MGPSTVPPWLTTKDAARHVGLHPDTLRRFRREGRGPRFARLGRRLIRYSLAALDEWLKSHEGKSLTGGAA
jgi:excisionase family DNA binding protein